MRVGADYTPACVVSIGSSSAEKKKRCFLPYKKIAKFFQLTAEDDIITADSIDGMKNHCGEEK